MSLAEALRVPPKQDRSGVRVNAIVDAARAHYNEVGRDAFTVAPVAEAVGCSTATVFRYFSKNQLLHLVEEKNEDARTAQVIEILSGNLRAKTGQKTVAMEEVIALLSA